MKKKRLCTVAAVLMLSLTACGSQTQGGTENSSTAISTKETAGVAASADELAFPLGQKVDSPSFTGNVYISSMITPDDTYHFPATNNIIFEPGARSSWHSHGGMVILVTGGAGYYQEEGKPAQIIREGDVINIPEGTRHWHGATPDSWFSQMVIFDAGYTPKDGEAQEDVAVTDEEYANLETEEYAGRTVTADNAFMFQRADEAVNFDTFSGPAYVSDILGEENAAGAPGLHCRFVNHFGQRTH